MARLDAETLDDLIRKLQAVQQELVMASDDEDDPVFTEMSPLRDRLRRVGFLASLVTRQLGG